MRGLLEEYRGRQGWGKGYRCAYTCPLLSAPHGSSHVGSALSPTDCSRDIARSAKFFSEGRAPVIRSMGVAAASTTAVDAARIEMIERSAGHSAAALPSSGLITPAARSWASALVLPDPVGPTCATRHGGPPGLRAQSRFIPEGGVLTT